MRRIIALAFLLLLASGVLGATVFSGQIAGASGKRTAKPAAPTPSHVIVDNTPLPVSGTVTVGNTPNVKLDPTGNTVQLAAGASVKTSAADNPAFQPVQSAGGEEWVDGSPLVSVVVYTVPAGKELVIEQVSFRGDVPTGEDIYQATLSAGGLSHPNFLNVIHQAPQSSALTSISGSTLTRIYASPGDGVFCDFIRYPATGTGSAACAISGYLVNLP
jgi:hypothetical protein